MAGVVMRPEARALGPDDRTLIQLNGTPVLGRGLPHYIQVIGIASPGRAQS